MSLRIFRVVLVLLLCQSLVFSPLIFAEQLALPAGDLVAPKISFSPISKSINAGDALELNATVTDNVRASNYERMALQRIGQTDQYNVAIDTVQSPGIEYYLQATDLAGNTLLRGYSFSPLIKNVNATDFSTTTSTVAILEPRPKMETEKSSSKKWLWIGLGVLAVGAMVAGGGGGSDPEPSTTTGTVTITGPAP